MECPRLTFPLEVSLKRLAAPLWVFCFGKMFSFSVPNVRPDTGAVHISTMLGVVVYQDGMGSWIVCEDSSRQKSFATKRCLPGPEALADYGVYQIGEV